MASENFKSISERVTEAFSEDSGSKDFAEKFIDVLLQNWRDAASALRRTVTLGIVLAVIFVLIAGASGSTLTLGPLRLSDAREVLPLLPAIIAFLFYEAMLLNTATVTYFRLIDGDRQVFTSRDI